MGAAEIAIIAIAGLTLLWMVNEWLNRKFEKLDKRLHKHDLADAKLETKVKSVKKDVRRIDRKTDRMEEKIDLLLEKQAA